MTEKLVKMCLAVQFPESQFNAFLHSLEPMTMVVEPPGTDLYKLAEMVYRAKNRPINIMETGSLRDAKPDALMSDGWGTFYFAKWIKSHPGSQLFVVELSRDSIKTCQEVLAKYELLEYANITEGDALIELAKKDKKIDLFLLDSCDGLEHGLSEFKLALQYKPVVIVMDDWDTKAALAAEYAASIGIPFQKMGRYTVFEIPESVIIGN